MCIHSALNGIIRSVKVMTPLCKSNESNLMSDIWPVEIKVSKDKKQLHISYESGEAFDLSAEMLRVLSPSAEVQGHSAAQRKTIGGKIKVEIAGIDPVGNYAIRIRFDDMHDTGIFTWKFLHEVGLKKDELWQKYLDELVEKGLKREGRF